MQQKYMDGELLLLLLLQSFYYSVYVTSIDLDIFSIYIFTA